MKARRAPLLHGAIASARNRSSAAATAAPERLAAAIPGARIEKVPGRHITAVIDPAFRRAIVEFLTR